MIYECRLGLLNGNGIEGVDESHYGMGPGEVSIQVSEGRR
jgi:hypothetical protein